MADGGRFELPGGVNPRCLSKTVQSTALPSIRFWCSQQDSNLRPPESESGALSS